MRDTKTASFLIVNYKSSDNVRRLILEIKNNFSYPFEILIFDNSGDFKCKDSNTKIYSVNKNIGFGTAVDYLATRAKYDYLFIFNPDITIINSLDEIIEKFIELPLEYAVISLNRPEKLYNTPFFGRFLNKELRFSSNAFVTGRDYFVSLGGFNPNYFMYFEDNEFALLLKKLNLKTLYLHKEYVIHNKNYNYVKGLFRKKLYYKSFLYFLKSNYKIKYIIFLIPLKIALFLSKLFK